MNWHKYRAQKTTVNGITFPSKLESAVYTVLLWREKCGEITDINLQESVRLKEKCSECGAGAIVWKVDFSFTDCESGQKVYCEAKGVRVSSYIKREKIWRKTGPGKLEVWSGSYKNPKLTEVIIPSEKI